MLSYEARHLPDDLWFHKREAEASGPLEAPPEGLLLESDTTATNFLLLENAVTPEDALLLESA